jgi:hypothetical protein
MSYFTTANFFIHPGHYKLHNHFTSNLGLSIVHKEATKPTTTKPSRKHWTARIRNF